MTQRLIQRERRDLVLNTKCNDPFWFLEVKKALIPSEDAASRKCRGLTLIVFYICTQQITVRGM